MKVVHYISVFSQLSETFIYDLVLTMEAAGVENYILCLNQVNDRKRPFNKVKVIKLPSKLSPVRVFYKLKGFFFPKNQGTPYDEFFRRKMEKAISDIAPDVIYAHFGPNAVLAMPVAEKLRIPLACMFHGYDASRLIKEDCWVKEYKSLLRKAALVMTVSNSLANKLKEISHSEFKFNVVYNGIDLEKYRYFDRSHDSEKKIVRLIFIGRLIEKKDPVGLVNIIYEVLKKIEGKKVLKLSIIGEGPLKEDVLKKIREFKISDHVDLKGSIDNDSIPTLLNESDLYVQHSITALDGDTEGLPVSILEAAATGLPVISTLHSGIVEEVIEGKTGYLFEENDNLGMSNAIVELVNNPQKRYEMGRNAREMVEFKFDLKKQVRIQIELLQKCLV